MKFQKWKKFLMTKIRVNDIGEEKNSHKAKLDKRRISRDISPVITKEISFL